MAEPIRRASDRFDPSRVPGSRDRSERATPSVSASGLPGLLPPESDSSGAGQGLSGDAGRRDAGDRPGFVKTGSGWTASSVLQTSGLITRPVWWLGVKDRYATKAPFHPHSYTLHGIGTQAAPLFADI